MSIFDKHPDEEREELYNLIGLAEQKNAKLVAACKLVLLYHSASPWDDEKRMTWANGLTLILGPYGDGTWDGTEPTNEATTKKLCNAVRAALKT